MIIEWSKIALGILAGLITHILFWGLYRVPSIESIEAKHKEALEDPLDEALEDPLDEALEDPTIKRPSVGPLGPVMAIVTTILIMIYMVPGFSVSSSEVNQTSKFTTILPPIYAPMIWLLALIVPAFIGARMIVNES